MLLIDFILSQDGQQILAKANYFPVRSDVPPNPTVARVVPEKNGFEENFVGPDKLNGYTVSSEKIYQALFR
jgi:ABC-type Fe3+ transport system substrate-binding protein